MYRMECVKVGTLLSGEIDCADFRTKLLQNRDKPAIINVNIGLPSFILPVPLFDDLDLNLISKPSDKMITSNFFQEQRLRELLMILIWL